MAQRGYFGIGIENGKDTANLGILWRSAHFLGASFIFTVGNRYRQQHSDTSKAWRHIPLFQHGTLDDFLAALPHDCPLVGVEFPHEKAKPLPTFDHPKRAVYLLGAEDRGLSERALERCSQLVYVPSMTCLNVAVAGSILMYDRQTKAST